MNVYEITYKNTSVPYGMESKILVVATSVESAIALFGNRKAGSEKLVGLDTISEGANGVLIEEQK